MPIVIAAISALVWAAPCWAPPVDAPVVDPFRAPACTYCPGNRGIEYAPAPGQSVAAVSAGAVSFAGRVAGTLYVVVDHPDGLRATYGRLASLAVRRGQPVSAGATLGTTTDGFYFGVRRGTGPDEVAVDPTPMLGVRRYPARLVPVDGTLPISPGPGRLVCRNTSAGR